jgi:hypothetical protein
MPETDHRTQAERAAEHCTNDLQDAKLVVLREEEVFRHVEFVAQKGLTRVILVTWPYNLLVAGSHGSYHFERYGDDSLDMFDWLRGIRPNPASWASKLVNGRDSVEEYDQAKLVQEINERVAEAIADDWAPKGLRAAVQKQVIDSGWLGDEQNAMRVVAGFEHGKTYRATCSCGETTDHASYGDAVHWEVITHEGRGDDHQVTIREASGFDFDGWEEWNVRSLTYHYLWACHSAAWGIAQYDAAKAPAEVAA